MDTFSKKLIDWYLEHKRDLPWRNTHDPYRIWLSEIILQQTRVNQGMAYFLKFTEHFPTVQDLANANQDDVLKLWQGLGYYSRARNLHFAAQQVVSDFEGSFPNNYKDLLTLKGVGEYTAAAVASFAFKEVVPVVDGNVYRFLSRYFGIDTPIDSSAGKKEFKALAQSLISHQHPDLFNQAVMEFGAIHCKPAQPYCISCPFQTSCIGFNENTWNFLPVKSKKTVQKDVFLHFFIFNIEESTFIVQRPQKGIWGGLFEFPKIEFTSAVELDHIKEKHLVSDVVGSVDFEITHISSEIQHILSHRIIHARFWHLKTKSVPTTKLINNCRLIRTDEIDTFALPRLIDRYLENQKEK